jgi:sugar lactone lactonase YvrE
MLHLQPLFILLLTCVQALCADLREIYRFPNGTWIENIATRPDGSVLVTLINKPELWHITPSKRSGHAYAQLVHHFDEATQMNGITELEPDTYAVIASGSVWTITLDDDGHASTPEHIATFPEGFLNGMAAIDGRKEVVLSDSVRGLIYRLDIGTGNYSIIHQDETMAPADYLGLQIGINGLRVEGDYLYYSNTPKKLFCCVRIDPRTGLAKGPYEVISSDILSDDFAVGPGGVGYLAGAMDNVVTKVLPDGSHKVIAGSKDSTLLMTATSAAFGRAADDRSTLYVTTGGETTLPGNSTATRGGKVMALAVDF